MDSFTRMRALCSVHFFNAMAGDPAPAASPRNVNTHEKKEKARNGKAREKGKPQVEKRKGAETPGHIEREICVGAGETHKGLPQKTEGLEESLFARG